MLTHARGIFQVGPGAGGILFNRFPMADQTNFVARDHKISYSYPIHELFLQILQRLMVSSVKTFLFLQFGVMNRLRGKGGFVRVMR